MQIEMGVQDGDGIGIRNRNRNRIGNGNRIGDGMEKGIIIILCTIH